MLIAEIIYDTTFVITTGIVLIALGLSRAGIKNGGDVKRCTQRFLILAASSGLVSGIPIFYGAMWLFDVTGYYVNVGHGEILVAAPLFNLILGIALAAIGKILLQWTAIKW